MLPLLWGEGFAGRVEVVADAQASVLRVRHIWLEDGVRRTRALDAALAGCMKRLARVNECGEVTYPA